MPETRRAAPDNGSGHNADHADQAGVIDSTVRIGNRPNPTAPMVLMNKAQRKDWRRHVFGRPELTPAHRLVLLALEGFADYPDGTNARPGVKQLAEICALKPRVVEYALALGRDLGLIRQTARANPKRNLAAVYRLIPAPVSTRTGVHVETDSIRTDVRVDARNNEDFNPHEPAFLPARNDISTRTSVQPTNPLTPSHYTEREKTAADCVDAAPAPMSSPEEEQQPADPRPAPFCADHMPNGAPDKVRCADCGTRRVALAEWKLRHPEAAAAPIPANTGPTAAEKRQTAIDNCDHCDANGQFQFTNHRGIAVPTTCDHKASTAAARELEPATGREVC